MNKRIMVVDDEAINRKIVKKFAEANDYDVVMASNGEEALQILHQDDTIAAVLLDVIMPVMDGYTFLSVMRADEKLKSIPVIVHTVDRECEKKVLHLGANDCILKPFDPEILLSKLNNCIAFRENAALAYTLRIDQLTGLYTRYGFLELAEKMIQEQEPGFYVLSCFDIEKFKVLNDLYGTQEGDQVLINIGNLFRTFFERVKGICCRVNADNFALLYPVSEMDTLKTQKIREESLGMNKVMRSIIFSVGRYIVNDKSLPVSAMYDRAMLAKATVKGRYDEHIAIYREEMRDKILKEQEIVSQMDSALQNHEFEVWYQPQYNHESGAIIGAEALVRWRHSEKGLISPGVFIPIFEKNGFVYEIDKYVWEQSCIFLNKQVKTRKQPIPVSVNISRYDIFQDGLVSFIKGLMEKYELDHKLLRLEVTESAFASENKKLISIVQEFKENGFTIEIDDFGSGYSSLNTLKDVPADVLKLDMKFLSGEDESDKSGNIIASIVRMTKWIGMSVIAEGVETIQQANFLRSIGCFYIQGYLYSKPLPQAEYEKLIDKSKDTETMLKMESVETYDVGTFWNPASMDSLIFNTFIGAACIFEYHDEEADLLRVNRKFVKVFGEDKLSESQLMNCDFWSYICADDYETVKNAVHNAITLMEEVVIDITLTDYFGTDKKTYARAMIRVIAKTENRYLFYCLLDDTTEQRMVQQQKEEAEQKELRSAEQLKIFMNSINGGVSAIQVNEEGKAKVIFHNEKYFELFGYTKTQIKEENLNVMDLILPEDREKVLIQINRIKETKKPAVIDYRCRKKNGKIAYIRVNADTMHLLGYEEEVITAVLMDITEEKETNEQLRFLNETAHDILAHPNSVDALQLTMRKMLSYFKGDRAYVIEFHEDTKTADNTYEVCAEGVPSEIEFLQKVPFSAFEYLLTTLQQERYAYIKDISVIGDEVNVERKLLEGQNIESMIISPLYREGKMIGFVGVDNPSAEIGNLERLMALADYVAVLITHRDLDKTISQDSKAISTLMNDTPGGFAKIWIHPDQKLEVVYGNTVYYQLFEMSKKEFEKDYNTNLTKSVHPDDIALIRDTVNQLIKDKGKANINCRLLRKDGSYLPVKVFGRFAQSEGKAFLNCYYEDMSEQLKKEEMEQELLNNLACGAGLFEFDGEALHVIHVNRRYWTLMNRKPKFSSDISVKNIIHPNDYPMAMEEIKNAIKQKRDGVCDLRLKSDYHNYKPFHVVATMQEVGNHQYRVFATYMPITSSEMSIQELLPVALATMMRVSNELSYLKDRDMKYMGASSELIRNLGLHDVQEIIGKSDEDLFPPLMAKKTQEDDQKVLESGNAIIDRVDQMQGMDGKPLLMSICKYPIKDGNGNVFGIYSVNRDITHIKEQESLLHLCTNSIKGGVAVYSIKEGVQKLLFINDGFYTYFGYNKEEYTEATKRDLFTLLSKKDQMWLYENIQELMQDDHVEEIRNRVAVYRKKNGEECKVNLYIKMTKIHEHLFTLNIMKELLI